MAEKKQWQGYYSQPGSGSTYGNSTPVSIDEATKRQLQRRAEQAKEDAEAIKRGEYVIKG